MVRLLLDKSLEVGKMRQSNRRRLALRRETFRRLGEGELARVAGGEMQRCTFERSGCHVQDTTAGCCSFTCVPLETKVCPP